AWSAWRPAGEARRLDQRLQLLRQTLPLRALDARREADVMEQTSVVVEAEQQRADNVAMRRITEAADHAVSRALGFDLHHAATLAREIRRLEFLGDDAVEIAADAAKPAPRLPELRGARRQDDLVVFLEVLGGKAFELAAPLPERPLGERFARLI